jgi:hypothetical protein
MIPSKLSGVARRTNFEKTFDTFLMNTIIFNPMSGLRATRKRLDVSYIRCNQFPPDEAMGGNGLVLSNPQG